MRGSLALAVALAFATGCAGDGASDGGGLDDTLAYFPTSTSVLAVVSTDLESEQFDAFDRLVGRRLGQSVESLLRQAVEDEDLSWDEDVEPLLGRELVLGVLDTPLITEGEDGFIAAFRAADGDKLREVVEGNDRYVEAGEASGADLFREREREDLFAIDGDVLVVADDEKTLREALARPDRSDRLTGERFGESLEDLPEGALVRVYGDLSGALASDDLKPFRALPWVDALRTAGVAVSFEDDRVVADFALNTDPDALDEDDLPLATGRDAPEVLDREGQVAGGNRNQSLTTAFLFRLAELRFPDSRFVRDVHELERELGIDFAAEVLRQFDGPSASAVSADGETFAARSTVRDPEALERLLPRLAPHLPRLVAGLEALQSEGQVLLFLFAPDVLALQSRRVEVERAGDLWRVSGLTGEGPDQLFFGVLDDVFVVASDAEAARSVADEDTREVEGARGAGLLRADLAGREHELQRLVPFGLGPTGEIVAWLEASEERLRGRLSAELR